MVADFHDMHKVADKYSLHLANVVSQSFILLMANHKRHEHRTVGKDQESPLLINRLDLTIGT